MDFGLLDRYLLGESVKKADVVTHLLRDRPDAPGAAAFYAGLEMLGPRTPDLTLIALRLVLAGKKPVDEAVIALRDTIERARAQGLDAANARDQYYAALA